MKTKPFYLVVDTTPSTRAIVKRVRSSWPMLEPGEIVVRLTLDIPDAVLPQIQEIAVEDLSALGIAVEPVAL